MKKLVLLCIIVVGLFAAQADAGPYQLDALTARTFTQLSTNPSGNTLQLVIDNPGLAVSTVYLNNGWADPDGAGPDLYGENMQLSVGFAGVITGINPGDEVIWIGTAGNLYAAGYDSLLIPIANDNDDVYRYHAWVSYDGMTIVPGAYLDLIHDTQGVVSVAFGAGPSGAGITHFGFDIDLLGPSSSDHFHTSVVPVPAAVILGILGMGVAGLKLRKYA